MDLGREVLNMEDKGHDWFHNVYPKELAKFVGCDKDVAAKFVKALNPTSTLKIHRLDCHSIRNGWIGVYGVDWVRGNCYSGSDMAEVVEKLEEVFPSTDFEGRVELCGACVAQLGRETNDEH